MNSLRIKVSVMIVAPLLIFLFLASYRQYLGQDEGIETRTRLLEEQLGEVVKSGLRQGMVLNNHELTGRIIMDITSNKYIKKIWVIDLNGTVKESNDTGDKGRTFSRKDLGCDECHRYPVETRPHILRTTSSESVLRVTSPIANDSACVECHSPRQKHLGMLLIDASLEDVEKDAGNTLRRNLATSLVIALGIGLGVYLLIDQIIVKRVETLHNALQAFSKGDFAVRIAKAARLPDELSNLREAFNAMAEQLARRDLEISKFVMVREKAIVEERERIARELHDGIAQLLAYINAKNQAARMMIKKGEVEVADKYLGQIESEVQKEVVDVRSAILGLKMFGQNNDNLAENISYFVDQCNRFNDIYIKLKISEEIKKVTLSPNIILQVLRVVQEAVSNIRKHSFAETAGVDVSLSDSNMIEISIHDDGVGFDGSKVRDNQRPSFGLITMRERAEEIGAVVEIESKEGQGAVVKIKLRNPEKPS